MSNILKVEGLSKTFSNGGIGLFKKKYSVKAVQDVSFSMKTGETLGVVGESGCGKSTLARCVLNLIEPTSGKVSFDGFPLDQLDAKGWRQLRQKMQIIFQDPYSSLNPKISIGKALAEPLKVYQGKSYKESLPYLKSLLKEVGLPETALDKYPHEFSGGQRQRIAIARAMILKPDLVVADEAVSALDVSVQAQILEMLSKLQQERGLSFLFITHDLGVVRNFCDRALVMYLGRVVEAGPVKDLLDNPRHPYTKNLRDAAPIPDVNSRKEISLLEGEIPSPASPPPGCPFHPRCENAISACREVFPEMTQSNEVMFACHNPK